MTDEDIQSLHKRLSSGTQESREAAAFGLRRLDISDLERLADFDATCGKRTDKRMRNFFAIAIIGYGAAELLYFRGSRNGESFPYILVFWALYGCGLFALARITDRPSRVHLAEALTHSSDPRVVRLALKMLGEAQAMRRSFTRKSPPAVEQLRVVLRGMLPNIRPEDTADWTAQERDALLMPLMEPTFDTELTIKVLRVLGFAGTAKARNSIKSLLQWNLWGSSHETECVRQAAKEALPLLEERLTQNAVPDLLLRPASSPAVDDLLRVPANPAESPENLLRAASGAPKSV